LRVERPKVDRPKSTSDSAALSDVEGARDDARTDLRPRAGGRDEALLDLTDGRWARKGQSLA
jgi:hypothetical protein